MINIYIKQIEKVWFGVAFELESICATSFAYTKENVLKGLKESLPEDAKFQLLDGPSKFAGNVISLIKDIYDGKDVSPSLKCSTENSSDYSRKVMEVASLIPPGYVTSYGALAKAAGGSPRAVGGVMAKNPLAPICPCHRVVSSDLSLGGYGGGLDIKLAFLKREMRGYDSKREIEVDGRKLQLYPVEWVLKKLENDKG